MCDLNEAEQQSAQALRAHLNCVDRLLELQKGRLAVLGLQWTSSLEELISEYNSVRCAKTRNCTQCSHTCAGIHMFWNPHQFTGRNTHGIVCDLSVSDQSGDFL